MADITTYPAGTFCWVDLTTTDTDGARDFYMNLFGWTAQALPTDQ